jgi:hypothetical protein
MPVAVVSRRANRNDDIPLLPEYGRAAMSLLRAFLLQHRALAFVLVAAALCMKVLVPTGFMIGQGSKVLTIEICDDAFGNHAVKQIAVPMKDGQNKGEKAKGECPFTSLSMATLGGVDPALLALALAFIIALGFAPATIPTPERVFHLRPPLRGPPAFV